ncbi:helix-turn-helix domain-containing protein [Pectobacterium versatile]|uniref:Helix-turn-helix domain-containing protein n=2 Tax=Pectobacterium TaxID=122277 RepID=A0AAW3RRQ3_9GAMM|nr:MULTISPECIES: helix-turn-helix domain-containing protein [Pectobacterium]MBA0159247.1 XRE family transcriptional regulator [Pectobacterium versatile]MBB1527652.1 XRE family transcriptional regulator [Pectobacterium carotovorum subsp. carotovorum]MBQ4770627.1 helix-turn-helix domain-containing protein [Pectobacterium versatile]MCA6916150.1 helix-turn-helix domain-containing protein [Pectobacterium versatile]MCA6964159.1 helix-turn-helix domain-containing protein [Pectobacterium carotovorum]
MATLKEMMAKRSPESRARIEARTAEIRQEITLAKLREELNMSQTQLALALGVKQPSIVKMEKVDNDPKLSTLKRYVTALGGKLTLDVTLPDGKRIALTL